MTDEMFHRMLQEAALDAGVTLRQIEARQVILLVKEKPGFLPLDIVHIVFYPVFGNGHMSRKTPTTATRRST